MNQIRSRVSRLTLTEVICFVTTVFRERQTVLSDERHVQLLRQTLRDVNTIHPFGMRGYVFLPDHIHLLIYVPNETDISKLMQSFKRSHTSGYKDLQGIESSLRLWQRSFYDHVIRSQTDFVNHLNYIHYNPVKQGQAKRPEDFRHSSYTEYVRRGWYDLGWGYSEKLPYDELEDARKFEWGE